MSKFSLAHSTPSYDSFPDPFRADDDPHTFEYFGRAVVGGMGREKLVVDPVWNERVAFIGGSDLFGRPLYRISWGWNELSGNGDLRFPHVPFQWLLLKRFPASAWGTQRSWYAPRIDEGRWMPSFAETWGEDFPVFGGEEISYAFPKGTPFCLPYIEYRLRSAQSSGLPSREQRIRDARAALEAEEQETWNKDYDQFVSAAKPFYGNPFIGYGGKSGPSKSRVPVMTPQMQAKFEVIHADRMGRWKRQGKKVIA